MNPDPATDLTRRDDLRTLGLVSSASADDILQAYMKLRRALRKDSPAMRSAASEQERCEMLRRVEEAYRRLSSQAGMPIGSGGSTHVPPAASGSPPAPLLRKPAPGGNAAAGAQAADPLLELRAKPSPFRPRPSRPRT